MQESEWRDRLGVFKPRARRLKGSQQKWLICLSHHAIIVIIGIIVVISIDVI